MLTSRTATLLLAASVVTGVAVGLGASAVTSDSFPSAGPSRTAEVPPPDVEVNDPEFVMNDDGTATLVATVINHADRSLELNDAVAGPPDDLDGPALIVFGRGHTAFEPGRPTRIGGVDDDYRIRFSERVIAGSIVPMTLEFMPHDDYSDDYLSVTFTAPVVARTAAHVDVANNGPNKAITVHDAKIVVIPGQEKAYIGGWTESMIDDVAYELPTAVDARGAPVTYRHQTATGGPYGFMASATDKMFFGTAPFTKGEGDRDYVRASDVQVGEKITVTIRFPSGDVVADFKVVQGKADGTV